METVVRKVCDPITKQIYEIQLPARAEIKKVVPQLDFPPEGFRYRDMAAVLAKKFQLSDEQIRAKYKSHVEANSTETVWGDVLVFDALRELSKEGKLEQPGGRGKPYVLAKNVLLTPLNPVPEESIEKKIPANQKGISR